MNESDQKPEQPDEEASSEDGEASSHDGDVTVDIEPDSESTAEEAAAADDAPPEEPPPPAAPKQKRFSPVGWLALLVSLAALAGVGWLWNQSREEAPQVDFATQESVDAVSRSLRAAEESIAALQSRVSSVGQAGSTLDAEIAALNRELQMRTDALASLPGRMSNLEGTMSSLQGISSGVRDTWLLAEAEYYLQIANAQLQLAGNPHLASLALKLADEKILALANPALTNVRRAIADEIQAIEVMEKPDIEGISLTLSSLAAAVDALPLRSNNETSVSETEDVDPELSGFDRAMASLKSAVGSVVTVRQVEEAERPFAAPEAETFLRANLNLQLQVARLALLRGEQAIFEQSIEDAGSWLGEYYDTDSTAVQNALQTFDEIKGSSFLVSAPDISGSLRLLRQFNTLSEYESTAPADEEAPEAEPAQ